MLWLIFGDYDKKSVKTSEYIRFLNWYVWVIFAFIMMLTVGFYITSIYFDVYWIQILMFITAISGGLYFGNELRKTVNKHVGSYEDIYDNNIITLRQILKQRKISHVSQIDLILEQLKDELPALKVSDSILKPFYTLSTVLLIPTIAMLTKWLLDKSTNGLIVVIQITALIVMIFCLFYMLKPLIEQILDITYRKMKKLQQMLQDIKLLDFLK